MSQAEKSSPARLGNRVEIVEFVDVTYPRVRRLFRDRGAELFGRAGSDHPETARAALGVDLGEFRLGTDVEISVISVEASRFPLPSCLVVIECTPVQAGKYVDGMRAEVTAYPVSRTVTGLTLDGTYRLRNGHNAGRLLVHRAIRACVEDLIDRLVRTIRVEAEAVSHR